MGKLTRKVDPNAKSGIAPYDGEDPKPGMYRARIIKCSIRKAKNTDSLSYSVFYELEATKPEHKKYDGYSGFAELWLGDKEALLAREATFYKAVTGKAYKNVEDVNVVYEGTEADFAEPSGAEVTKIDGKAPKGRVVKVSIQLEKGSVKDPETGEKYPDRLRVSDIYPSADADDAAAKRASSAEMEDDDVEDAPDFVKESLADDEEVSDEDLQAEIEERRKELRSRAYGLAKLKEAAQAAGIYEKGMDKTALVEAILDYEFADEDGEDDDEDADDATERTVAGAPDASDESDDEDDEEEEEEEEDDEEEDDEEEDDEDDEDDPEAELREELAPLDRSALKARIKGNDESVSIKKSMTDDDLRDIIVKQELSKSPF